MRAGNPSEQPGGKNGEKRARRKPTHLRRNRDRNEGMASGQSQGDPERDRTGSQKTGEPIGSVFDPRECALQPGQRVDRTRAGGTASVSKLWRAIGSPWKAGE